MVQVVRYVCDTGSQQDVLDIVRSAYDDTDGTEDKAYHDVSITQDGTWQKRGFSSKYGVIVAIELLTGMVLDYELLSLHCQVCKLSAKRLGKNTNDNKKCFKIYLLTVM